MKKMSDIERTCENCRYDYEDIEGEHCRHCICNATDNFEPKTTNAVVEELKVVFEQTVAEILDKTGSDFTIEDFNLKPFTDRVCDVVRKAGEEP